MVLVTVVLLMTAMLVASAAPAWAALVPVCCRVSPPTPCNTVAGLAGFEWRAGGTVCWFEVPAWVLVQDTSALEQTS
jgi:hypothetical protein